MLVLWCCSNGSDCVEMKVARHQGELKSKSSKLLIAAELETLTDHDETQAHADDW